MFSVSKLKTFKSCPLKYKYSYVEKWTAENGEVSEVTTKGLALHETFERYQTGFDEQTLNQIFNEQKELNPVDETKYKVREGLERFYIFWNEFVAKKEKEGYVVKKEQEINGTIMDEPFIGFIDLLLEKRDSNGKLEKMIILDYKTPQSINTDLYYHQLNMYAYILGTAEGMTIKEIAENLELYVFFPLAKFKNNMSIRDKALSSLVRLIADEKIIKKVVNEFEDEIKEIRETDFDKVYFTDGKVDFSCKWCEFAGSISNGEGFYGCLKSYEKGYRQLRCVKYVKKQEEEKQENADTTN